MKIRIKILFIFLQLIFVSNHSYSQLPSYGDLGFLNTYKENKFYWGISFPTFGKIKSINQTKYKLRFKSGKLQKGRRIGDFDNDSNYYIKYDELGRVIETIDYPKYSNHRSYTYNYDEFENLIEVKGYNPDGDCVSIEKYTYNEFGKLIQEDFLQMNTYKKYTHNYDKNDNNIETFYTELHGYSLIQFLADVFLLEESSREPDICLRLFKSYDKNGNLVKLMTYNSNCNWDINLKNLREIYKCEYDSNGKLLKEFKKTDVINETNSTIELNHYYNEIGLKTGTKLIFDFAGCIWYINTRIIRDINGSIIEITESQNNSLNKNIIEYSEKFEYDNYNNISKIYFFKNDKPKFLIERKTEYY